MILDKLLIERLNLIGKEIIKNTNIDTSPKSSEEMFIFWSKFRDMIEEDDTGAVILGNILFNFLTNKDIRDRQTNSRLFEDIFASLFNSVSTDISPRKNPYIPEYIKAYDKLDSKISSSLAANKREKCDVLIDDYGISLKTLKGPIYNKSNEISDSSKNTELNIGSLSYKALLKDCIPDEKLNTLSDRKSGLGSGKQLRENVFNIIKDNNKTDYFYQKLNNFLSYIYKDDDIYIILKAHYHIIFYFIPGENFVQSLLSKYKYEEESFEKIWYRWENNNLRLNWVRLLEYMDQEKINYYSLDISLTNAVENHKYRLFLDSMEDSLEQNINLLLHNN